MGTDPEAQAYLGPPVSDFTGNFIDNAFVTSDSERWILVHNPCNHTVLTRVPRSTDEEVRRTIDSCAATFNNAWSVTNKGERQDRLFDLAALMRMHEADIAVTIVRESGRTYADAASEVRRGVDMVKFAAACIDRMGERGEMKSSMQIFTDKYPIGVCAVVSPFNLPFLVPLWSIPFALAMGNTVVCKPSELCPTAAMWLAVLVQRAGFPPGCLNIVHGGGEVAMSVVRDPRVQAVSVVGSEEAGNAIWDECRHGVGRPGLGARCPGKKRVQGNVSSQNHAIIMPDCPRDFAVNALVESAFGAAGQRCTSPRIAVLVGDAAEWLDVMRARAQRLVVGDSTMEGRVDLGPLISRHARDRVVAQIGRAVDEGARLILDGRGYVCVSSPQGNWLGPTILSDVTANMECYQTEIFGPVLLCMTAETLDDAIVIINNSPKGNGCSIFTNSGASARQFQRFVNVGIVNINNPNAAPPAGFSFTSNKASFLGGLQRL